MFIDLIGNDPGIIFFGELSDDGEFLFGENLAAGVGGIAEDQALCPLLESGFQLLRVEVKGRRAQGDIDGLRP